METQFDITNEFLLKYQFETNPRGLLESWMFNDNRLNKASRGTCDKQNSNIGT